MTNQGMDFDQAAASWDQEPRRVRLAQEVARAIAQAVPLGPAMEVLDFGCGTGLLSLNLRHLVGRITGADTSRGMLRALEAKVAALGSSNVTTWHLDPQDNQTLPGSYDLIVSNMTLHHVEDVPGLLARLAAALKPGGHLALADLDPEQGQFHPDEAGVFHHGFERAWLRQQMRAVGLTQVQERTAAVMNKPARDGVPRDFSIFLLTGGAASRGCQ
jgi:tRNA (cmo5U34)-methyltransferase